MSMTTMPRTAAPATVRVADICGAESTDPAELTQMLRSCGPAGARDIVAALGRDRVRLRELVEHALGQWAEEAPPAPAAEDARVVLLAAFAESGPTAAYARKIANDALRRPAGTVGAKEAIVTALDRLLDALHDTIVPAELASLAATIAAYAGTRADEAVAARLAGTVVAQHVLAPHLSASAALSDAALAGVLVMALTELGEGTPFGTPPGSRLGGLRPDFERVAEAFDAWVEELVLAGAFFRGIRHRRPGADPDDLPTQAEAILANDIALAGAFMAPTPVDPLGTRPRCALTAIGRAIETARQARSTDYDWVAVQQLADREPFEFAALLRDERLHVLDHVRF
jgi:hypothetical protein